MRADSGCTADAECSDGLYCNGAERCVTGRCAPAAAAACSDGGSCDEARDTCGGPCTDVDRDGVCAGPDCDDTNPNRYPGALERCDSVDQDCNPVTLGPDEDMDLASGTECCNPQSDGAPRCGTDCDDQRATVNPSALEACNDRDDDCDGTIDEGVRQTYYRDEDTDGYGAAGGETRTGCTPPPGFALMGGDCDDTRATFKPGGTDSCALAGDDNCSGAPDEGCTCATGTTQDCGPIALHMIGVCRKGTQTCIAGQWETACANVVEPTNEVCNMRDDDCDGVVDDGVCVACPVGFSGMDGNCTDINECLQGTSNCHPLQMCGNTTGGFNCGMCPMGYSMPQPNNCQNINECVLPLAMGGCDPLVVCQDTPGGRVCAGCPAGYSGTGDTGCVDVDECATNNGGCAAGTTCTNLPGSRMCGVCPTGFMDTDPGPGSTCVDVDECSAGTPCGPNVALCVNTPGTYRCQCQAGFTAPAMAGTCVNVNECAAGTNPCGVGTCTDLQGTYQCSSCPANYAPITAPTPACAWDLAALSDLRTSAGVLGPVFSPGTLTYSLPIRLGTQTLTLTPAVPVGFVGTITVLGQPVTPGSASAAIPIPLGTLEVTIVVRAASGRTQTYVVRAIRGFESGATRYIKASNTGEYDNFGVAIALSADGSTLAVGAPSEDSAATGINGSAADVFPGDSGAVYVFKRTVGGSWAQEAYIKASNAGASDQFGGTIALSANGDTLAVGATREASNATGVGGNQADNSLTVSGAVYVFARFDGTWSQQAYVKASNTGMSDVFGCSVALSADGSLLAVGAYGEDSSATGIGGNQTNDSFGTSGAVYLFRRTGSVWAQEAYVKASNTGPGDRFGVAVSLSGDGSTLVVGADGEDSSATGVGGNQANSSAMDSGAVYVFRRGGTTWAQDAYIKASNTGANDLFGSALALSDDGSTLAVGATQEASSSTGVGGNQADNSTVRAGAVYLYRRTGSTWVQEAYIKASNTGTFNSFACSVTLSADGLTLAVGARGEESIATGIGGNEADNSASGAGAVYVFRLSGSAWAQGAYFKASNTDAGDQFGVAVALSADGSTIAVGAGWEASNAVGVGGNQADNSALVAGAVYTREALR